MSEPHGASPLEPHIIDYIKRKEKEKRRREQEQPSIYDTPPLQPEHPEEEREDNGNDKPKRGVVEIVLKDKE